MSVSSPEEVVQRIKLLTMDALPTAVKAYRDEFGWSVQGAFGALKKANLLHPDWQVPEKATPRAPAPVSVAENQVTISRLPGSAGIKIFVRECESDRKSVISQLRKRKRSDAGNPASGDFDAVALATGIVDGSVSIDGRTDKFLAPIAVVTGKLSQLSAIAGEKGKASIRADLSKSIDDTIDAKFSKGGPAVRALVREAYRQGYRDGYLRPKIQGARTPKADPKYLCDLRADFLKEVEKYLGQDWRSKPRKQIDFFKKRYVKSLGCATTYFYVDKGAIPDLDEQRIGRWVQAARSTFANSNSLEPEEMNAKATALERWTDTKINQVSDADLMIFFMFQSVAGDRLKTIIHKELS